jgi:hypothetical protein
LKLVKAKDLPAQLSNAEWLNSATGTPQQKRPLLNCVGCHTLERIFRSKHDTDGFVQTIQRMGTYANQSTVIKPQKRLTGRDTDLVGEDRAKLFRTNAEYFSSINQHKSASATEWPYELKPFPRPKGPATRVIITEWDMPRPTIQPHDVVVDSKGTVWYTDFGDQNIGKFDPKTGKLVEIDARAQEGLAARRALHRMDRDENLWVGMIYQARHRQARHQDREAQVWPIPASGTGPTPRST